MVPHSQFMEQGITVSVSGAGLEGKYVLEESREDGSLVLRPDTSIDAIRRRLDVEPVSDEEFETLFGDLPTDGEG